MNLQLSEILGIPPLAEVVVSAAGKAPPALIGVGLGETPYVVFHPFPNIRISNGMMMAGWRLPGGLPTAVCGSF